MSHWKPSCSTGKWYPQPHIQIKQKMPVYSEHGPPPGMVGTFLSAYFSLSPQSKRNINRFRNSTSSYIHDQCRKHSHPSQLSILFTIPYCPSICSHSIFSFFCPPAHQYYSERSSYLPHYPFKSPIFFSHFSFSSHSPEEYSLFFHTLAFSVWALLHTSHWSHRFPQSSFSLSSVCWWRTCEVWGEPRFGTDLSKPEEKEQIRTKFHHFSVSTTPGDSWEFCTHRTCKNIFSTRYWTGKENMKPFSKHFTGQCSTTNHVHLCALAVTEVDFL